MNDTALYKGVREYGMNSIYHTMQAINTEKGVRLPGHVP